MLDITQPINIEVPLITIAVLITLWVVGAIFVTKKAKKYGDK